MSGCYVVSDLHLFSQRSLANKYLSHLRALITRARRVVFTGDIIDFRWSYYETHSETLRAARSWLDQCLDTNENCQFHYVLGNHDHHAAWADQLEQLAQQTNQFYWEPYHLRLGNALFVHGDAADPGMTSQRLSRSRNRFAKHRKPARWQHHAYDLTISSRLHVATAKAYYPDRVVVERLSRYLHSLTPELSEGIRNVYFGHTHRLLEGRCHKGVCFHNGGAPMPGMPFRILEAKLD